MLFSINPGWRMAGMKLVTAFLAAMLMSSCAVPAAAPTCLDVAETGADGKAIRAAPLPAVASGGKELCEGIALIRDQKGDAAREMLTQAAEALPVADRWLAQGALAWSLTLDKQDDAALELWDAAIAGAIMAGDRKREGSFRMIRGTLHARREEYAPALEDFSSAFDASNQPQARAQAAYSILGMATTTHNLGLARSWYPRFMQAAAAAGDAGLQSKGAEFYAQMLEEAGLSEEAAATYEAAVTAAKSTGRRELQAEMLEYQGQAQFTAGSYRGGELAYSQAAQLAREAGQNEFADQLEDSLRTRLGRYENGNACEAFLEANKPDIAERAVTDVPPPRRSWSLQACEVRVFIAKSDPGRARLRLDELVEKTGTGWPCDQLRALARQIGMTVDAAPQMLPAPANFPDSPPMVNIDRSQRDRPVYDGKCRLRSQ